MRLQSSWIAACLLAAASPFACAQSEADQAIVRRAQAIAVAPLGTVPESLENLILEHYGNPQIQRQLLSLLARETGEGGRFPRYRSRKLFDLLHADMLARRGDSMHYAIRLVATDLPGIEAQLLETLPKLNAESANELVLLLGWRRHAPAVPALRALQARIAFAQSVNGLLGNINWALLRIGTPEAAQAVLDRVAFLARQAEPQAGHEVASLLDQLAELPPDALPRYASLRAVLPATLTDHGQASLVKLIVRRKENQALPDLLRLLGARDDAPLDAILALGRPQDWRDAKAALARLAAASVITQQRQAQMAQRLETALADPAKQAAAQAERERMLAFEQARTGLLQERERLVPLRESDPPRYAREFSGWIDRVAALLAQQGEAPHAGSMRQSLVSDVTQLAQFHRFRLKQPDAAIALYRRASAVRRGAALDVDALAVADILRFDKRDKAAAIAEYRRVAAALQAAPVSGHENALQRAVLQWIRHEVAFLESGKPFGGTLGRDDLAGAQAWLMLIGPAIAAASEQQQTLEALPPSQTHIPARLYAVLALAPTEQVAFFTRHDPAGYISASLLALVTHPAAGAERRMPWGDGANAKQAAAQLFRERGIHPALEPDARFASVEKTWALFLASARGGDVQAMLSCFTPSQKSQLEPLFTRMSREELRKMADSFVEFVPQGGGQQYRTAFIMRVRPDGSRAAGEAAFLDVGGEWKIESM